MILILILGFFVLGCNFNCKAMNEDFAPGYCKNLCKTNCCAKACLQCPNNILNANCARNCNQPGKKGSGGNR